MPTQEQTESDGRRETRPQTPFISVVMPVRNEERFIRGTLERILEQRYPADRFEVLVCDGRSNDSTRQVVGELAERDERVRLLDNPGIRSSSGRNVGFRAARGEIAVVIDGHVSIPSEDLLRNIADCFRESGADCLGRPQPLLPTAPGGWSEAIALARTSRLGHSPSSLIYDDMEGFAPAASNGAAYRDHVFERVGFVDETFDACEDLEFNTRIDRAGLRCYTSPRLTVQYYARDSVQGLFRQLFRYGFGRFKYIRRYPSALSLSQLAPPGLVLGTVLFPLLILGPRAVALAAVGLALVYVAAILAGGIALASRGAWRHLGRFIVILPAIHYALGMGFLASTIRRGRSAVAPGAAADRPEHP